jgi:O-antigen ligase
LAALSTNKQWHKGIPSLLWVVVLATIAACVGGETILGYQLSGLSWAIPMGVAIWVLSMNPSRVKFPFFIWAPWVSVVIIYVCVADAPNAIQRSIMLLCPLVVGMAVSTLSIGTAELEKVIKLLQLVAYALAAIVVTKAGILITGKLPEITGMAAEVITGSLLACIFATQYAFKQPKALLLWSLLVAIPIVALTRTGIVVATLTLPLTFAPLNLFKRVLFIGTVVFFGIVVFNSERVQKKMFYSGRGSISDIRKSNENFRTAGRSTMWDKMIPEIEEMPLLGHGANASEPFVSRLTGGLTHPHNDWLRLLFDYGYVGTALYAFTILMQTLHALKFARQTKDTVQMLFYIGASSFLSFFLFMFTDNIILYAAFFGNLQFMILGLAYASLRVSPKVAATPRSSSILVRQC